MLTFSIQFNITSLKMENSVEDEGVKKERKERGGDGGFKEGEKFGPVWKIHVHNDQGHFQYNIKSCAWPIQWIWMEKVNKMID